MFKWKSRAGGTVRQFWGGIRVGFWGSVGSMSDSWNLEAAWDSGVIKFFQLGWVCWNFHITQEPGLICVYNIGTTATGASAKITPITHERCCKDRSLCCLKRYDNSLDSFPSLLTVYPDFDSYYSHFMPYRMTPSVRHRAIEVHYYYYYYYYYLVNVLSVFAHQPYGTHFP